MTESKTKSRLIFESAESGIIYQLLGNDVFPYIEQPERDVLLQYLHWVIARIESLDSSGGVRP